MKNAYLALLSMAVISGCQAENGNLPQEQNSIPSPQLAFTSNDRPIQTTELVCLSASTSKQHPDQYQFNITDSSREIDADWGYNNDWGWWLYGGDVPPVRSCMKRDGTGWYFDLAKKYANGAPQAWMSPTLIAGDVGWDHVGNKWSNQSDFPVKAQDIDKLIVTLDYDFQFSGVGNTNITLSFQDKSVPINSASKGPIETEVMIWLRHNVLVAERRNPNFYRAPGSKTDRFTVNGSPWFGYLRPPEAMGANYEFHVAEIHVPNSSSQQSGKHAFELDLSQLIQGMINSNWIDASDTLIGLEFKNEVSYGTGVMDIQRFTYDLAKRG